MDEFEKIEKLVDKAGVTFEEARDALRACGGDLLDAMGYLEKLGKTKGPEKSSFSTDYEEQEQYENVDEKVNSMKARTTSLGDLFRKFWDFVWNNSFVVSRNEKELVKIPVWLLVVLLIINWKFSAAVLVVALFFGCRYAFAGQDDMRGANAFMDKAGDMAEQVKEQVKNSFSDEKKES